MKIFQGPYNNNHVINKSLIKEASYSGVLVKKLYPIIHKYNNLYEEIFGIAGLRRNQEDVIKAEEEYVNATKRRKQAQFQVERLHQNIRELKSKIDATPRTTDTFLDLITREHKLVKEEFTLVENLHKLQEHEEDSFDNFSKLLRRSHKLEIARLDKTRYLGFVCSLVTAIVWIISQNNSKNLERIKDHVGKFEQMERSSQLNGNSSNKQNTLSHADSKIDKEDAGNIYKRIDNIDAMIRIIMEHLGLRVGSDTKDEPKEESKSILWLMYSFTGISLVSNQIARLFYSK